MTAGVRLIQIASQFEILNALGACGSLYHPSQVFQDRGFF